MDVGSVGVGIVMIMPPIELDENGGGGDGGEGA